jgi:meiotically up-regulated gene 157 (Mug157) protein
LIRTFFRPSDDATLFQYNIPGNALVSAVLAETYDILSAAPTKNYLLDVVCTKLG